MWGDVKTLWEDETVHGLELIFDTLLLTLRRISIWYWVKKLLADPEDPRRTVGVNVLDGYCALQLIVLLLLLLFGFGPVADSIIAGYILFDIYLTLFNIVFIRKFTAINAPPVSIERSILLLFINVLDVIFAFGIFYRDWLGLSSMDAIFKAVLVLGTIGYPESAAGSWTLLVCTQILLDFALIVLVFGSYVGQLGSTGNVSGTVGSKQ